jgi:hypothetical protein
MASTTVESERRARSSAERRMYTGAAIAAALVVFAGFARTYYLKSAFGTPDLTTLKQVHGAVMTGWFALFVVQGRLVATGRTAVHRKVGVAGAGLAALVVAMGTMLGIASARAGATPIPSLSPLVFLVMPIGEIALFAGLVAAGLAMRKRPAWHKRFMLLSSVAILTPAMARLPFDFIQAGGPPVFFALTDLVVLACIAVDTAKNRRLHPAFAMGFVYVLVMQFGRLAFSQTQAWMNFARWLVA